MSNYSSNYEDIRPQSTVFATIHNGIGRDGPEQKMVFGRAVMCGSCGWVINVGGRHGTPHVVTADNFVKVRV